MAGAAPAPTLLPIDTRASGWEAVIDQNFQNILAWLRDQPTQIKRAYHDSSLQPTSGTSSSPYTILLKDFPAANYRGHMLALADAATVSGYPGGSNAAMDPLVISDGTNWCWLLDGSSLPAAV